MLRPALAAVALLVSLSPITASLATTVAAAAPPQAALELTLQRQPSQPKWIPEGPPLFGDYFASGDGSATGVLTGRIGWDLYEDHSRQDRHPTLFRGFLERDGRRYPFEIIGIYSPDGADGRTWRISGAITFDDSHLLGTPHAPITGTYEAATKSAYYTVWVTRGSQ
jgi:hypothetical protein